MKWKKYAIATTASAEDVVVAVLNDLDITAIEIEDYKRVPEAEESEGGFYEELQPDLPDSDEARVIFYLDEDADDAALLSSIRTELDDLRGRCDIGAGTIAVSVTDEADWRDKWKEYFHSFMIGDILIRPSWETREEAMAQIASYEQEAGIVSPERGSEMEADEKLNPMSSVGTEMTEQEAGTVSPKRGAWGHGLSHRPPLREIIIDPGISFGTGQHETTRMCIEALAENVTEDSSVLDIGCGSGILSVAALKLGAKSVAGTDIDEACMESVRRNFEMNGLDTGELDFYVGDLTKDAALQDKVGEGRYEVVVANILADIIIGMLPQMKRAMKKDGVLILSGIIDFKEEAVLAALTAEGFSGTDIRHNGEWVCIVARQ